MKYLLLSLSIILEVFATTFLKYSEGFSKLFPSLISCVCYICCFYLLSLTLKMMPVGIAYAIWAGVGIVLVTLVGAISFKQVPDAPSIIGMLMIIAGVLVMNLLSKNVSH